MLTDADRLIEATRQGGRIDYRAPAGKPCASASGCRAAVFLHNRVRHPWPLARLTAERFEIMLSRRLILRDLPDFIDRRIRRIHGRRVADLLHDLVEPPQEEIQQTLDGLRLQYPGYAEALERRFIRRTALRLEEAEYQTLHADGLVGAELHTALKQDIAARRAAAETQPRLDLAVGKAEFVKQFPVFADVEEGALKRLQRALVTRHVNAGDVILRRDEPGRSVYFIASGAVEMETAGQTELLGRGEMFGLMGVLLKGPRRAIVKAIAPSTLLVLDEERFRRVLKKSAALRGGVRESAIRRGLDEKRLAELGLALGPEKATAGKPRGEKPKDGKPKGEQAGDEKPKAVEKAGDGAAATQERKPDAVAAGGKDPAPEEPAVAAATAGEELEEIGPAGPDDRAA